MVKKFSTFGSQLEFAERSAGPVVHLTNEQKLSLYKKSQKYGIPTDILEEVYRRGYTIWNESFGQTAEQFAFDRVNSFIAGGFAASLDEDLMEKRGLWDNIHAKRERIKHGSGEHMRKPGSKGAPTDAAIKASQNEEADPCWDGYEQIGMKKKNGKKVPNCVPVKEDIGSKKKYDPGHMISMEQPWHPEDPNATYRKNFQKDLQKQLKDKLDDIEAGVQKIKQERQTVTTNETYTGAERTSYNFQKPNSRFIGTNELTKVYKDMTPGQSKIRGKHGIKEEEDDSVQVYNMKIPKDLYDFGLNKDFVDNVVRKTGSTVMGNDKSDTTPKSGSTNSSTGGNTKSSLTPGSDPVAFPGVTKHKVSELGGRKKVGIPDGSTPEIKEGIFNERKLLHLETITKKRIKAIKEAVFESYICENCDCGLLEELINERGADSKGYKRPTEQGAGLTAKGAAHYRREHPGSKLSTAVTEKNPTGRRAARRRSFCARMSGVKGPMKDEKGRPTRKAMSLRRWRC